MFKSIVSSRFHARRPWRPLMMLLGCVFTVMLSLTSIHAQDEEADKNKPAQSVVRGRVILADSEQPLRRATLRLRKDLNQDFLKRAITGKRGEFSFRGMPAGTYYIEVDAPGILPSYNPHNQTDLGASIEGTNLTLVTVDGTNDVKTEVRATRGGTITGRISYADGEPATRARVVLYRQKGEASSLFLFTQPIFTDDRGVYRIEGLPAGQYVVGGIENNSGAYKNSRESFGLVAAYHPSASTFPSANMVSVQLGSETRDVNIKFVEEPRQISGRIKWKDSDLAVKNATILVRRVGEPQLNLDFPRFIKSLSPYFDIDRADVAMRDTAYITLISTHLPLIQADDTGSWSFDDVPPGTYMISVQAPVPVVESAKPKPSPNVGKDFELASALDVPDFSRGVLTGSVEVTIKDKNLDGVLIELTGGASIAGSIVVDGELDGPLAISAKSGSSGLYSIQDVPTLVKSDRTFVLQSVQAGSVRLDISEQDETQCYVRSITFRGQDLLKEPLTIADGEQVTGVQIVLGTDMATVEGRVVAASGSGSVAGSGVLIVPVDERKRNLGSLWGMARADAEGRFTMRMAPGEYFVVSWSPANEPAMSPEAFAHTQLSAARRVSLQPDETKPLEIRVSTSPKP